MLTRSSLAALALAASPFAQDLIVVDAAGGPGSDFTQLGPAVAAAADGDVVLIRPGTYEATTIQGKGLVLLGDDTGPVHVASMRVEDLLPAQHCVVRNVRFDGTLWVLDCAGAVWLEDCELHPFPFPGLIIGQSDEVVLTRCTTKVAATGHDTHCVTASDSHVVVHDSVLRGLDGYSFLDVGGNGGHGLRATNCSLVLSSSTLQGGDEGDSRFPLGIVPGDGLHAVSSTVEHVATAFHGGQGGHDLYLEGSTEEVLALHALTFDTASPVAPLAPTDVAFEGVPGGLVFLGVGSGPTSFTGPALLGQILIDAPYAVLPLGPIGPGGTIQTSFLAPPILPGTEAGVYWLQSLLITPVGGVVPGAPSAVVVAP